jgi:serine/threonine-protein kinase RsbW
VVAANIALRTDFDLDAVEDTKLAVDEMCSTLITRAAKGATLICCFRVSETEGTELDVHAYVPTDSHQAIDQRSFGWRVLSTLTDSVRTWVSDGGTDGQVVHIQVTKAQQRAQGE